MNESVPIYVHLPQIFWQPWLNDDLAWHPFFPTHLLVKGVSSLALPTGIF